MGQDSTDMLHPLLLRPVIQPFVREQIRFRKQQPGPSFLWAVIWGLHLSVDLNYYLEKMILVPRGFLLLHLQQPP